MKTTALRAFKAILLALSLISVPLTIHASPPPNTDEFRYLGEVQTNSGDTTGFFVLEIKSEVYGSMDPSWRDLRIYNNAGQELGYTPLYVDATEKTSYQELEIINKGMLQNTDIYSFTVKGAPANINQMTVKLNKYEYLVRSEIYGSNDNQTWQMVGKQTLYCLNGNYNSFSLRGVEYPYLRFEFVIPKGEILSVIGAQYTIKTGAAKPHELQVPIVQTDKNNSTMMVIDLGSNNHHSNAFKLNTTDKNFSRRAYLEVSNNREEWQQISSFYLYRGADKQDQNLRIEYPLTQARYLKIILYNGDDTPVIFKEAVVEFEPVRLLVKDAAASAPFTVQWGNPRLSPPAYDVKNVLKQGKVNPAVLPVLQLDQHIENLHYKTPTPPLTERYPFLLPLALGVAIIIVGIIQFRSFNNLEQ